jgi:hypothetical protein
MEALIEEMLDGSILLAEAIGEFEKIYIQKALEKHCDHLTRTADVLGIHRNTLSSKLSSYKEGKRSVILNRPKRTTVASKKKSSSKKLKARAAGNSR